jgi:methylamine dehydrogenase accessory protein MauD
LPVAEIATAVALVFRPTARWGAIAALGLLLCFVVGITYALTQGRTPDCHCFGQIHSEPAGRSTLLRNALLAGLAIVVVVHGPGPAVDAWVRARSAAELVAVGLGISTAFLAALSWRLWNERGDLRRDVERLQAMSAAFPPGLPVGTAAPEFDLPDLMGERMTLAKLRGRGRPVLLAFARPTCGPCTTLFPALARWQRALADRITIAVISTGSARDNRPVADEHGLVNILLEQDDEVTGAYRTSATPSAVLVTAAGRIGSEQAVAEQAIEALVRVTLNEAPPQPPQLEVIPPASAPESIAGLGAGSPSG